MLGVVCTALGLVLFFRLVIEAGPSRAAVITYVNPLVAVVLEVLILDELRGHGGGRAAGHPGRVVAGDRVGGPPRVMARDANRPPAP